MADVELRSTGVLTGVRHRQGSCLVFLGIDLTVDLIARASGSGHAPGSFTGVRTTSLGHETWDHPVESKTVIEAVFHQLDEVGHGVGCVSVEQLELDQARLRFHQSLGHGAASKTGV